jgi:hypothetical protein
VRPYAIALGAVAIALFTAPAAQAGKTCRPQPRHATVQTVAANDLVRVYKIVDPDHAEGFPDMGDVYACDRATGWRRKLGLDGAYPDLIEIRPLRVVGRLVAYSNSCTGCRDHYRFPGRVSVLDMATRHHLSVYTHADQDGYATDLVLAPSGSVAWISAESYVENRRVYVVRRHDSGGTADLDRGRHIDPRSLTLDADSVLQWTHSRESRSAPLGPP